MTSGQLRPPRRHTRLLRLLPRTATRHRLGRHSRVPRHGRAHPTVLPVLDDKDGEEEGRTPVIVSAEPSGSTERKTSPQDDALLHDVREFDTTRDRPSTLTVAQIRRSAPRARPAMFWGSCPGLEPAANRATTPRPAPRTRPPQGR